MKKFKQPNGKLDATILLSMLSVIMLVLIGILLTTTVTLTICGLLKEKVTHMIIDTGAILAAILAIFYAVKQKYDTDKLQESTNKVQDFIGEISRTSKEIAEATSTKFVAIFPENLPEIVKLINKTEKELLVLCDFAGYGHISNPKGFIDYRQAIERLGNKAKVRLVVYDDKQAKLAMQNQLGIMDGGNWTEFVKKPVLLKYAERHKSETREALSNRDAFISMVENDEKSIRMLFQEQSVRVGRTSKSLPFYIWVSDETEVIISYISMNPDAIEYSFHSKDIKFIHALLDITKDFVAAKNIIWEN